jgi:hypothetical protein
MTMILKIFLLTKLRLFAETAVSFCKNFIMTLVVEKNANFSPKIGQKT